MDIGEKGLAPIGVDREEIGATRHMGATVIRHGGIIPPMNGAGTRPTLATASSPIAIVPSTWRPAGPPSMPPPPHLAKQKPWNLPRSGPRDRCQPLPALRPRTAAPDQSPPPLSLGPPAHRASDGRLEPNGQEPGFYEVQDEPLRLPTRLPKPPHAALRLCPPLTLPRARTILPEQPNSRIHRGNLRHDRRAEPTGTASHPRPAPYNPQGS